MSYAIALRDSAELSLPKIKNLFSITEAILEKNHSIESFIESMLSEKYFSKKLHKSHGGKGVLINGTRYFYSPIKGEVCYSGIHNTGECFISYYLIDASGNQSDFYFHNNTKKDIFKWERWNGKEFERAVNKIDTLYFSSDSIAFSFHKKNEGVI